ncbi:hypothetical protein NE852_12940 [Rhizobium sp. Pop5]|uniref:hypothetical protein n=1 Tax=Rhizobium sp. Pop5 TaxID=1223565 RepID=UPI0002838FF8|nr:hypothetical protein [Rhizobium sp. Pop5]EJZ17373.1 hypothetical protein RCCGEPOP_31054 [Rhizobium sp. Pop5]UVD59032.1 hypothetical protein NE852_12940 [Rhizobium sp. Pop5]
MSEIKQLKRVGFFRELPHGDPEGPSLKHFSAAVALQENARIVSYLRSGALFIASPGLSRDVLSDEHPIIGSLALWTDGTFLWPSDLSHYVEKYSVGLPREFIKHMEGNAWTVPAGIDIFSLED